MNRKHDRYGRKAFTLVEIMVVVVIIGVMATVVTLSVTDYLVSAKQNVARSEIATIKDALSIFFMEHDRFPSNDEGLGVLRKQSPEHPNGILRNDLEDPWGSEYIYVYPGVRGAFDLLSYGADRQEGGTGADVDITSWSEDRNQ